ncbi:hypothetical protein GEV33_009291 [Tenebrio molitor]|uniref:Uncharacterized protein n=1 Tax=Tenebrio molitor TaxID=7067 RepID=A0A8J6L9R3_TENMO|nr:hypothetical protein GEV33_009291 [Tenebrio molitor]
MFLHVTFRCYKPKAHETKGNSVALSIRGFNVFVLFGSVCQSRAGSRRENAPPIIKALKNCSAGKGQGRRIRIRTKRGEGLGQHEWATGSIFFYFLIGIGLVDAPIHLDRYFSFIITGSSRTAGSSPRSVDDPDVHRSGPLADHTASSSVDSVLSRAKHLLFWRRLLTRVPFEKLKAKKHPSIRCPSAVAAAAGVKCPVLEWSCFYAKEFIMIL